MKIQYRPPRTKELLTPRVGEVFRYNDCPYMRVKIPDDVPSIHCQAAFAAVNLLNGWLRTWVSTPMSQILDAELVVYGGAKE